MADDPLRELLTSPLDTGRSSRIRPARTARGPSSVGPWLAVGVAMGALAVIIGFVVGGPDEAAVTTQTVPPPETTTSSSPAPLPLSLPPGYTPIQGGRLGLRVERVLVRPDAAFVTVSAVVPSGIEGDVSAGFDGGSWELEIADGRSLASVDETMDPASPGYATIRFPAGGYTSAEVIGLTMTGVGHRMSERLLASPPTVFVVPSDGSTVDVAVEPGSFEIDSGVTLVVTAFRWNLESVLVEWALTGSNEQATAAVAPELDVWNEATDTMIDVNTIGEFGGFVFAGGFAFFDDAPMRRTGEAEFVPTDFAGSSPFLDVELGTTLHLNLTWRITTPANVQIPIGDAPRADVG